MSEKKLKYKVGGYEEFCALINGLEKNSNPIFVLFRGTTNDKGVSWCPDCVKAEPVIQNVVDSDDFKDSNVFVEASVGLRDVWKDPKNPFRTDPRIKISCIPTILKWKGDRISDDCSNPSVLKKFFQS